MAITLTIDRGNGSAKIALWNGEQILAHFAATDLGDGQLDDAARAWRPEGCMFSTVCNDADDIRRRLDALAIPAKQLTAASPLPIEIGYATPLTLGTDRIAAAVAAYTERPGQAVLVVDIGTAVTYDVVDSKGRFVGGNIAPGIGMRLRALNHFTSGLPRVESRGEVPMFGYDTPSAMRAGAVRGVVGEMAYYRQQLPEGTRVVLTGGWADDVADFLPFGVEVDKLLVNRGLNRIYIYNETA